jgi:branched-chain amino acid transport system ATP-binding protein
VTSATGVLRTDGLTVRFGGLTALSNVSVSVPRGQIRAVIGPNGAGKSTFFNCLTGVIRPTAGRIVFDGDDITGMPPYVISRKGLARSYQITNILPGATVLENVRIAAQSRHHNWSMLRHHRAYRDVLDRAHAVLRSVGLDARRRSSPPTSRTASSARSRSPSPSRPSRRCSASTSRPRA